MKTLRTAAIIAFGLVAPPAFGEEAGEFVIPEALKYTGPEITAAENNLPRFLDAIGPSVREEVKAVSEAGELLREGKKIQDGELLEKLRARHRRANESLNPPLAFVPNMDAATVTPVFFLFQGSEVLAKQAMLERDHSQADRLLGDMFRWSHLLRTSRPNFFQILVARFGWQTAFNTLLRDWVNHPDQTKRFDEIEKFAASNRLERSELIEALKAEFHWVVDVGGVRKMLEDERYAGVAAFCLKPPFNKLSNEQLLALPDDAQADFRRISDEALARLDSLKRDEPIIRWPGFELPANASTLEDYAKRPNGLGDLFHEQADLSMQNQTWSSALSRRPLLDACLRWLKLERDGQSIDDSCFKDFLDPVDGKPLKIDIKLRTIRTRGPNQKADPPDVGGGPLPAAGFFYKGDDSIIVVPRWRNPSGEGKE
jgi:hypothetical protein